MAVSVAAGAEVFVAAAGAVVSVAAGAAVVFVATAAAVVFVGATGTAVAVGVSPPHADRSILAPTSTLSTVKPPDLKNLYNAISSLFSIEGPDAPRVTNSRAPDPHQVSFTQRPRK